MLDKQERDPFIGNLKQKFATLADTIPLEKWGFQSDIFDLLREARHTAVDQRVASKNLKVMTKKEKSKLGKKLGPKADTVTDIIKWMNTTELANKGVPKAPVKKDTETEQNEAKKTVAKRDLEKERKIAAIMAAKGVGRRPPRLDKSKIQRPLKKETPKAEVTFRNSVTSKKLTKN